MEFFLLAFCILNLILLFVGLIYFVNAWNKKIGVINEYQKEFDLRLTEIEKKLHMYDL